AREAARITQCSSNSRQMGIASAMYATESQDYVLPWRAQAATSGSYGYCNYYLDWYLEPAKVPYPRNLVRSAAWTCPSNMPDLITTLTPPMYPSQRVSRRFTDNVAAAQGSQGPPKRYEQAVHPSESVIMGEHKYVDPRDT